MMKSSPDVPSTALSASTAATQIADDATTSPTSSSSSSSPSSSSSSLLESSLPESLFEEEILEYLSFTERRRLLSLSQGLWSRRARIESKTRRIQFQEQEARRLIRDQPFQSETRLKQMFGGMSSSLLITSLSMDFGCTDGFLHVALVELELFPNLQNLRLRSCDQVSDFGLDCISRSKAAANSLQVIDIAFCRHTSYAGAFCLRNRRRVPHLRILRRQPEWLDGRFETPFGGGNNGSTDSGGGGGGEIHTYYCDGSFQFNRDSQSNGFVSQLYPLDENFLGDKLQYNNFRAPLGWPEWTQLCYRPGVCLLRLPPTGTEEGDDETRNSNTVLVGQYMRGLRAPQNRPLMERAKDLVPLGQSRFFDKKTEELLPYHDAAAMTAANNNNNNDGGTGGAPVVNLDNVIMISRMLVQPLEPDQLMPPESLVQACRNTCQGLQSYGRDFLRMQEERLNQLLSGEEPVI